MKTKLFAAAAMGALVIGPAQADMHGGKKGKGMATACAPVTEAQINAQFDRFNGAWATGNPATVTALFAKDAVLLPTVSAKMRTTSEGVNDYFVGFLKGKPVGTVTESKTVIGCNIATRVGNWTVRLTDPATGTVNNVNARFSFIYTYDKGDWKIAHLHSSVLPAS